MDPNKIDLITQKADGTVVLIIVGGDSCDGSKQHLSILQSKVNTYLAFALEGELEKRLPEARGMKFELQLDCSSPLDSATIAFVEEINRALVGHGTIFRVNIE